MEMVKPQTTKIIYLTSRSGREKCIRCQVQFTKNWDKPSTQGPDYCIKCHKDKQAYSVQCKACKTKFEVPRGFIVGWLDCPNCPQTLLVSSGMTRFIVEKQGERKG